MARNGFEILGRFYPMPTRFRMGDPVLVREITGMDWLVFVEAFRQMEEEPEQQVDQVALVGLAGVAFSQGNPLMSRDKVRRAIERTWQDDVQLVLEGDDETEETDAAIPPEAGGVTPPTPPTGSNGSADSSSEEPIPSSFGLPGSTTGSPE